jgi:apolipoprotein N-acyltransferase
MEILRPAAITIGWRKSFLYLTLAVAFFQTAYSTIKYPAAGLLIFGYAYCLVRLTDQPNVRRAFYFGLATGFFCAAPQLFFFWRIFGIAAVVLWLVFAFWIGLFTAIVCGAIRRWGKMRALWLIPFIWTGLEYFRSELYYLKFSWLNIGYALPPNFDGIGMYGVGFLAFAICSIFIHRHLLPRKIIEFLIAFAIFLIVLAMLLPVRAQSKSRPQTILSLAGIQMEFPSTYAISEMLNHALAKNTNTQVFVLSEYSLDGGVPDSLKNWCRDHARCLVIGGKDFVTNDIYYNTAFVIGTNGEMVFKQAKSVPIQFFHDGLPAPTQNVWNSPWGKIGICICYDLSYTRVTDELVRQGAQLLIVPTMDVSEWGKHQHELHARVTPVRAAEYGIPIFRVASSGISQAVTGNGNVVAQTKTFGNGDIFAAQLSLPTRGTLPLDRLLAPFCVAVTGVVTAMLLFLEWKERRTEKAVSKTN